MKRFIGLVRGQEGATAAEYAIMVGLIATVIVAAVVLIGTKLQEPFTKVGNSLP
jgi:pilus assembly protein Flp/PilA